LGPEADVEVDTMTYRARPGDVFLLCSDGLTTMLKDARIEEVLRDAPDLDQAVGRLVREANAAGGRDNITVVAFRLEEAGAAAEREAETTLVGPAAAEAGLTAETVRAAASRRPVAEPRPEPFRPPRRRRIALRIAVALALVAVVAGAAAYGARQVYFLGADDGRLALYRGLPYELPLGVGLYSRVYSSPIRVESVPADRRERATDHTLRSHDDAASLIEDLEASASPPAGGSGGEAARGGADGRG
jgi:protein phosphatase